jgi:hypothetical protein
MNHKRKMVINPDGTMVVPSEIKTACGHTAYYDLGSGIGYRCECCNAILGSIGMPQNCKDMEDVLEAMGIEYD